MEWLRFSVGSAAGLGQLTGLLGHNLGQPLARYNHDEERRLRFLQLTFPGFLNRRTMHSLIGFLPNNSSEKLISGGKTVFT